MCDLFHEHRPTAIIDDVVGTIAASPHIGQLLTKRADVMAEYFTAPRLDRRASWREKFWLGFSAERQEEFDARWAHMRKLAETGWTVFVSVAPMLAPVVLPPDFLAHGRRAWAICSGEQGPDAAIWTRLGREQSAINAQRQACRSLCCR
jgi:protein gp37